MVRVMLCRVVDDRGLEMARGYGSAREPGRMAATYHESARWLVRTEKYTRK